MGHRLLNGHLNPRIQCVPLRSDETPELVYVKVADDLEFAMDPNSLCVMQVDGIEDFMKLRNDPPTPYVMAKYKPNFQRGGGDPSIRSLVLEACHDCNLACSYCFVRNYYCFVHSTKIPLIDGGEKTLGELAETHADQFFWVYSYDHSTKRIVPGLAHSPRKTGEQAKLLKVILDNEESVSCTPNHLWMLRDGSYRRADQLQPGDSLMPLDRSVTCEQNGRYEIMKDPDGGWVWTHRRTSEFTEMSATFNRNNGKLEFADMRQKDQTVRHHLNFNPRDNRPENLAWMTWRDHVAYHVFLAGQLPNGNPAWKNPEQARQMAKRISDSLKKSWADPESAHRAWIESPEFAEMRSRVMKEKVQDPEYRQFLVDTLREKAQPEALKTHKRMLEEGTHPFQLEAKTESGRKRRADVCHYINWLKKNGLTKDQYSWTQFKEDRPDLVFNHKVVSVEDGGVEDVYDITVEDHHNFALSAGVFVHNSDHGTGNYMTFETARSAIDRLLDRKQKLSVGFFGGEPMLNMKLIKDVTAYVEHLAVTYGPVCKNCGGGGNRKGEKCGGCRGTGKQTPSLHVTTNGTLYSEENLRFLEDHGFSLITSIDGTSEAHDALRPMKRSGRGSHKQIILGLNRMLKIAPKLTKGNTLRSTFSAMRGETIRERLEYLNQICDDGMASWVSVEPAAMSENTCFIPNQDELEIHIGNVWDRFYGEYMDTADWWIERAKAGKQPRFHNIHKSIERLFWAVHSGTECGAGAGYAAVNAKAEIFGCHRESNSYLGTLVNGIDPKLRQPWLDNRIYTRTGCMNCGHRYACGGGCREDSMGDKGNIHEPSNVHCALKEMWIRSALKVMASLPKVTIAKYCAEPNKQQNRKLHEFISSDTLPKDQSGIIEQKWVQNIPLAALVKEGIDITVPVPEFHDAPLDQTVVDTSYNPAGPVELSEAIQTALR